MWSFYIPAMLAAVVLVFYVYVHSCNFSCACHLL